MSLHRRVEGSEPVGANAATPGQALHRIRRTTRLGTGTLACPSCDAPVVAALGPVAPSDPLECPFCRHGGAVRDFLSLSGPARPTRVEVRVVHRAPPAAA